MVSMTTFTMDTLCILPFFLSGLISCQEASIISGQSPDAQVAPYYPEENSQYYPDYGYPPNTSPSGPSFPSQLDRQGLETFLTAPLVLTAFAAALLGGFLSPLVSNGLSRLAEYEIEWPEVKRKIRPSNDSSEARAVESLSWIEALEKVNQSLGEPRNKRSARNILNKFLKR